MNELETFVDSLVGKGKRYPTLGDLAEATGITLSAFSRGAKKQGTLSPENCLRLAETTGVAPSHVLRLAGKGDIAILIERLYGKADLTPAEAQIVERLRAVSADAQLAVRAVLDEILRVKASIEPPTPLVKSGRGRRELVEKPAQRPLARGR